MKKLWILAGVSVMVVLLSATTVFANNSWSKYHWDISTDESIADPLDFGDNTSPVWTTSVSGASIDWNGSVLKNEILAGTNTACDPVLGGVEICNGLYGDNGWLGIAQVWVYRGRAGHIAQGLVQVNDTYFNGEKYNTQAWRDYVMCQEIGHTIGLAHQDEIFDNANLGSCMDYTNDPDGSNGNGTDIPQLSNLEPDQHDYDVLTEKYGHLNGVEPPPKEGGKGSSNGKGKKDKGEAPGLVVSEWGKAISNDGNGRPNLFELNLGNGDKVFTHVLWAE